jgi:hypothetical protein
MLVLLFYFIKILFYSLNSVKQICQLDSRFLHLLCSFVEKKYFLGLGDEGKFDPVAHTWVGWNGMGWDGKQCTNHNK